MASLSPTRNASTAGARWLFAQQEWLRRCGDTPRSRARFQSVVESIEGVSEAELKRRLSRLKERKLASPFERDLKIITGEILLIEGELAYRKPEFRKGEAAYRSILLERAIGPLMRLVGEEQARECLAEAGRFCAAHNFKEGTDVEALIEDVIAYRSAAPVPDGGEEKHENG